MIPKFKVVLNLYALFVKRLGLGFFFPIKIVVGCGNSYFGVNSFVTCLWLSFLR